MNRAFKFALLMSMLSGTFAYTQVPKETAPAPKVSPPKVETKAAPPKAAPARFINDGPQGFDGLKTARSDQTIILDFNGELGLDPKFDAVPKPEVFRVFKDFSGKPAIIVTPGPTLAGKTILVVYADNKGNKTTVATHAIEVIDDKPKPPTPTPTPNPTPTPTPNPTPTLKYFTDLKASYLVSPDPASLDILIGIYKEMGDTTFAKRSDAATVLRNVVDKKLKYSNLRKVRDTVQELLEKEVGVSDTAPFDQTTYKQFWIDITQALAAVKVSN